MNADTECGEKAERVQQNVLTRAARRKAGLPPPKPLFSPLLKHETELETDPHSPLPGTSPSRCQSSRSDEEILTQRSWQCGHRHRLGPRRLPSNKLLGERDQSSSGDEEGEGTLWVQCDNTDCRKWRRLPDSAQRLELADEWFCYMHPLPAYQSCHAPEEKWTTSLEQRVTHTQLPAGQLVWVKATTWPPWPAIISPDPWSDGDHMSKEKEGCIFHVEFLGKTRSHQWLTEEQVEPYCCRQSTSLGAIRRSKQLDVALDQADSYLTLSNEERLALCEYREDNIAGWMLPGSENIPRGVTKSVGQRNRKGHPKKIPNRKANSKVKQPLSDTTNLDRCKVDAQTSLSKIQQGLDIEGADIQSELVARARVVEDLGIPLTLGMMVKLACSLVQEPPTPAMQGGGGESKPAVTSAPSSSVRQNATTFPIASSSANPVPQQRCHGTVTLSSERGCCPSLSATSSVPLAQASLNLTTGGAFQLTRRRESRHRCGGAVGVMNVGPASDSRGRKAKAKTMKKRASPLKTNTVTSHSIPEYFQQNALDEKSSHHRKGIIPKEHTVSNRMSADQQVPFSMNTAAATTTAAAAAAAAAAAEPLHHGELKAHDELREIEEMLSLFSDHDQETCGNRGSSDGADPVSDTDIDAMLSEMTEIEGLIQNLSQGQVVQY